MPKNTLPFPITDFVDISQDVENFGELKQLLQAFPESSVSTNFGSLTPSLMLFALHTTKTNAHICWECVK